MTSPEPHLRPPVEPASEPAEPETAPGRIATVVGAIVFTLVFAFALAFIFSLFDDKRPESIAERQPATGVFAGERQRSKGDSDPPIRQIEFELTRTDGELNVTSMTITGLKTTECTHQLVDPPDERTGVFDDEPITTSRADPERLGVRAKMDDTTAYVRLEFFDRERIEVYVNHVVKMGGTTTCSGWASITAELQPGGKPGLYEEFIDLGG